MTSNFSSHAVDCQAWRGDTLAMPPRAKNIPKELRKPTFIKAWRRHRGLTLEELASALLQRVGYEISDGQLSRIERGVSPYTQDVLEAIGAVLQTPSYQLLRSPPPSAEEEEADNVIRLMSPDERRRALTILKALKPGA